MSEQRDNQNGAQTVTAPPSRISRFGTTTDAVEAGRRGGRASGISRKTREFRRIEEDILSGSNAAAKATVLRIRLERDRALERERYRLDTTVCRLIDEEQKQRNALDEVKRQAEALEEKRSDRYREVVELEQRERELRHRLGSDAALDAWLLELGEERVTAAAIRIGWGDEESDCVEVNT